MASAFFGLTSATKQDLFLEECFNYMYAFRIGDLEQVMRIPVPFRKWLIDRWNKQKEKETKANDPNKPLTEAEKRRFSNNTSRAQNNPVNQMSTQRNGK